MILGVAGVSFGGSSSAEVSPPVRAAAPKCFSARTAVPFYRQRTWVLQESRDGELSDRTPIVRGKSCRWARYASSEWQARARAALRSYKRWFRETYEKWRCIHEHEGAWNDDNPPYWGGLQMTYWFQRTYGQEFLERYGTADRWPVSAQLIAAERAWRQCHCFSQWGTAGRCGL